MEDLGTGLTPVVGINNTKDPNFISIYSNNAAFALNFFDMAITFGELSGIEEGVGQVEQKVRIVMAVAHAKLFSYLMINQIQEYEKRFGEISMPPLENVPESVQAAFKEIMRGSQPK